MFGAPGLPDLLVTPVIIMLLFAVSCVSEDGKDLGSVIGSIRKGLNEDADRQFGLEPIHRECDLPVENGFVCPTDIIERRSDLSAFVTVHNTIAVGVINAIQNLGHQIPEDYSIVGIALGKETDLIILPLAAIRWQGDQIGQQVTRIPICKLNDENATAEHVLVPPQIEIRDSTSQVGRNSG
jgi:DNA-binding LacI/PurR family transcriptional regulator